MVPAPELVGFHHLFDGIQLSLCQFKEFETDVVEIRVDVGDAMHNAGCQIQLRGIEDVHVRQVESNRQHTVDGLWLFTDDHCPELAEITKIPDNHSQVAFIYPRIYNQVFSR